MSGATALALKARLVRVDAQLRGGLVVSCQPVDGGPMDDDGLVVRMAQAALAGGAAGLRIEGVARMARVRQAVGEDVPLIGIVKQDLADSPVRITPQLQNVASLAAAGADVIAVDATIRRRPVPVADLRSAIAQAGCLAMADLSSEEDARAAAALGFEIIGTTLSGYTAGVVPNEPDLSLLRQLAPRSAAEGWRLMAEGRYDTPALAAAALQAGAWAVTVGSAITRLEVVTQWFAQALRPASMRTPPKAGLAEEPPMD